MVQDLSYSTVSKVSDSWEKLRRIENFKEVVGVILYKKLFTKCPTAKTLFGFPINMDPCSLQTALSKRFAKHATYFVEMLDSSLQLLGPDQELLTDILVEMGERHYRYGVSPEMFPVMGQCLLETLEDCLSSKDFSQSVREAWEDCFDAMANDMVRSISRKSILKAKESKFNREECSETEACTDHSSLEFDISNISQ